MLHEKEYKTKYKTIYKQIHEENFLDTVSKEDRELFTDGEILSGKNNNGNFNTFNNYAVRNPDKPRDTVRMRLINHFKRFLDQTLENGEMEEVYKKLLSSSKAGDFRHLQYLMDRALGKQEEKIDIKTDGTMSVDLNISHKFKKVLDDNS